MNSNCTNRIVDSQHIIKEPYTEDYENTGYSTDDQCAETICHITGSGNGYQTCQRSIQAHGHIRFAISDPGKDHADNGCSCRSYGGGQENRTKLFYRSCSSTVKSVPAKPEDKTSKAAKGKVMSWKCIDLCDSSRFVFYKFSNTRSQHFCTDECRKTTYHMDGTGTCKIMKSHL